MWLMLSATIERTTHRSSTHAAMCGNSSLTSVPHWPCFANFHGDGEQVAGLRAHELGHARTAAACRCTRRAWAWGRTVSTCDGPPDMNRKMTRLALRREHRRAQRRAGCAGDGGDEPPSATRRRATRCEQAGQAEHAEAVGERLQHLAAVEGVPMRVGCISLRTLRRSCVASRRHATPVLPQSTYMNSFVHSSTWQYASRPARGRRSPRSAALPISDSPRRRRRGEERAVEPVDLRRVVAGRLASRRARPAASPASSTNGWFSRNSACGATVESIRFSTMADGVGGVEEGAVVAAVGADRHHVQRPARRVQVVDRGAAGRRVEPAGDGEQAVAQRLGVEPPAVHPAEQQVVGVGLERLRRRRSLDCWYVADSMIARCIALIDQPSLHELDARGDRAIPGASAACRACRSCSACGRSPRRSGAARCG